MPFGVDVKGITQQLKDSFAELMAEIKMMRESLDAILAELKRQGGQQ